MDSQVLVPSVDSDTITNSDSSEYVGMSIFRDPLYLFACYLDWRDRRDLLAYKELMAALDDHEEGIRTLAESLLHRPSPHPRDSDPSDGQ